MAQHIEKTITINANASVVWNTLTNPDLMKQWMAEPEMELEIITDWKVGSPIVIKGFHHLNFENKGTVLKFDAPNTLQYSYLSSLSRLPDSPENYSMLEFSFIPFDHQTKLTLTLSNFPTEVIFKHIDFYWTVTLEILKKKIESQSLEEKN